MEASELPDRGEIVLCTVREITPHGIYVDLDEYNNMNGFLHISEISTGWVRNIDRVAKVHQKLVLKVIRAERSRREVDLSLRQVTNEEKRNKLIEWKQNERATTIMSTVKKKLGLGDAQFNEILAKLEKEHGSLYDALEAAIEEGREGFRFPGDSRAHREGDSRGGEGEDNVAEVRGGRDCRDKLEGLGRNPADQGRARCRGRGFLERGDQGKLRRSAEVSAPSHGGRLQAG